MAEAKTIESAQKNGPAITEEDPCAGANWHPVKAWLCVLAALLFFIVGTGTQNMLTPILKLMLESFNADTTMGSNWSSILTVVCAVLSLPTAWALNKFGFRAVGYIAFVVLLGTSVWGALCDNSIVMLVIRALQGIGYVIPGVICVYCVTQWFPKDKQAFPITIVSLGANIARVVIMQISKPAIAMGGWRAVWWVFLVMCIIAFIFFIFFMKPGPGYAVAEAERKAKEERKASQEKAPLSVVLKNPYIWAITLILLAFAMASRGFDTFANMIFVDNCGVSNDTASDLVTVMSFAKMAAAPICGVIMGRFLLSRGKIISCMLTIFFAGMVFGYALNSLWMAWVFVIVVGVVCCIMPFTMAALPIFSATPAVLAMALTFSNMVGKYLAGFVAPYMVSTVETLTGSFQMCAIPAAVFSVIGIICVWFVGISMDRRAKKEKLEKEAA